TTFKIYFPRVDQPAEPLSPRPLPAAVRGTETILLVEDEESLRSLLRELLESFGYAVLEAGHGADALRVAEQYAAAIDLLLSDIVMPQMTGRELAERLARLRPGLKVLFMSGYAAGGAPQHEIPAEAAYIEKPFTADASAIVCRDFRRKAAPPQARQARSAGSSAGRSWARTAPLDTRPERACAVT